MATETQPTADNLISLRRAHDEILAWAGALERAIAAKEMQQEQEGTIRRLTGEIDRLTRERDTLAKNLEAEKAKGADTRTALQEELAAWQAKVEAAKAEHTEILARAAKAREEMRKIQAQLGVPVTG
jgi:seryl-tRNA synthetase